MAIRNKSVGSRIFDLINILFFAAVIVACIMPVWHVVCASFSDASWVLNQTGIIWRISGFNVNGYKLVFQNNSIWTGFANTIFYVVTGTLLSMLLTVMGAYAFSRKDFLWSNPVMFGISFTMMFSGGMIPSYILVTQTLHMYDSRLAMIIPTAMNAFNLIIIRTAMQNVPASLEESAMLDGAGRFTILFKIVLPLIKATLATVMLYMVVGQWNSWFNALIYLRTRTKFPLQLILREILITATDTAKSSGNTIDSSSISGDLTLYKQLIKYCTIVVSTVPMFIFYPFIQKYFESGVMIGAIKG
ncbi:MAG: carbohydrate ABC transporter permease [Oscillospiraceae bacterium]|nr:carbohydrate ABC transporter permease [Oscillospiraceae bacterium]